MTIDKRGQLTFCHIRDTTFDVNQYLLDLKAQLKNWRDVYWRVWGTIHYQTCSRCGETFSCTDYGHCKYHPESPRYDNETSDASYVGTYPCCHQKCLRFDPTQQNKVNSAVLLVLKNCFTLGFAGLTPPPPSSLNEMVLWLGVCFGTGTFVLDVTWLYNLRWFCGLWLDFRVVPKNWA